MISIWIILGILLIHWVADFVLQTDWQAKNKSSNNTALSQHVFVYSIIWWYASIFFGIAVHNMWFIAFAPITFVCHWVTDYFTSRLNTKLWKAGKVHEFFVSIGFDQILHYTQLLLTYLFISWLG